VFAPTNEAFGMLPTGTVETLVKPENKAMLTKILTYHVVPGRLTAADLMRVPIAWLERQFIAMGRQDAHDLALEVMARYQGAALLTSTLRDPTVMVAAKSRAAAWIDSLTAR